MRFEKPYIYIEVIERPQYVVPGKPEGPVNIFVSGLREWG
jgi:hypothetical protein